MTRLLRLLVAAALAAVAVAACSSDDSPSAAAGSSTPAAPSATSAPATGTSAPGGGEGSSSSSGGDEGGTITISNFRFGAPLTVAPGATIEVENEDTAAHDVVADDGSFKTPTLGKNENATFAAPSRPGTYKFSCSLHPGSMSGIGTLIVQS